MLNNTPQSTEVEYAVTEDKKLRNQLRNVSAIESEITALQIAALKKVNKSTKIILLDKNGSTAKVVAKELTRKGYSNVYVIDGECHSNVFVIDGVCHSNVLVIDSVFHSNVYLIDGEY